ncbi:hypothetical protein [Sphingobium sp. BS19]|uniref:hypothetical protein n=1 Tax=Sphingobium sp. BS19 TaxID=3018973 RepID=UPI0022EF1091|nr:hypothetical protein [Sphingobium sp. BS19]GLI99778.1 hypothetical protein Sbs19_35960 [Sphingobium sp. BS19]
MSREIGGTILKKFERLVAVLAIGVIALLALPFAISRLVPDLFSSKDVPAEGQSSDVDFPVVVRIKGGMLEVASVTSIRSFPKSSDPTVLGQAIPYCREKASWDAPYKITYRLRLGERWPLRYYDGTLIARVPDLDPSLPVAFNSAKLRKGAEESCWFMPDRGTRDRALKSISPELEKLAKSQKMKDFARESARKTVTEFLRTWAFSQTDYGDLPPDTRIKVIFPGE